MMPNHKDSDDTITIKKLSTRVRSRALKKAMLQHKLVKDYKHHIFSSQQNDGGMTRIEFLVRKSSYKDKEKMSKSDPMPRCVLTRKVTVTIMNIDGAFVAFFTVIVAITTENTQFVVIVTAHMMSYQH